MILINKHNLNSVLPAVSKEKSRYTLTAIHVTDKHTEATDGHRAIRVTLPNLKSANFPKVEGFEPNGFTNCLLPLETAKQLSRAMPKNTSIPVLSTAAITSSEGKLSAAVTDLENCEVFNPTKCEGKFPNLDAAMPTDKPVLTIGLQASYLASLAKSADAFGANMITLSVYAADKAILMTAKNEEQQEWTAMLMPMRL